MKKEYNPLHKLFFTCEGEGLPLTEHNIEVIKYEFERGGLILRSTQEVIDTLIKFVEWYKVLTLEKTDNTYILRNTNGN